MRKLHEYLLSPAYSQPVSASDPAVSNQRNTEEYSNGLKMEEAAWTRRETEANEYEDLTLYSLTSSQSVGCTRQVSASKVPCQPFTTKFEILARWRSPRQKDSSPSADAWVQQRRTVLRLVTVMPEHRENVLS